MLNFEKVEPQELSNAVVLAAGKKNSKINHSSDHTEVVLINRVQTT